MLRVEDDDIGKAAVGAMAIGAAGFFGATGVSLDAVVVSGWSKVNLEKSCEMDVAGTTTGSGLNDDAGMANSTRSRCWLSLIEMTIFSRSTGVMCFSRATFLLSVERWRVSSGRVDGAQEASSSSSDTAESRLEDSSGTGMSLVAARGLYEVGGVRRGLASGCAQQKVSRFQRRQLRFSRRLPSSIACDVLEKSDHCGRRKESGSADLRVEWRKFPGARVGTYHAKEVLDAAGVDGVQRRHFDA